MSEIFTRGQATLGYPTLGEMLLAAQSPDVLGISDRAKIIDYLHRAIELATWKANYNPYLGDMDICCDECGCVTLPSEVGVVLACNVGGFPAYFRNNWFEYHINGPGSFGNSVNNGRLGPICPFTWDDRGNSPVFQDLRDWSYLAAIVEDATDGNGTLRLQVMGQTMDPNYNDKQVITIPATGESTPGVYIPLLQGWAATDPLATQFKRITRVIKPVTRGYVKLIAFPAVNGANGRTIGYYAPNETSPSYRRIRVGAQCEWVRLKYRRTEIKFVYDTDIIPLPSKQALVNLLKAVRKSDKDQPEESMKYAAMAVQILMERAFIEDGPANFAIQVQPGVGIGGIDWR